MCGSCMHREVLIRVEGFAARGLKLKGVWQLAIECLLGDAASLEQGQPFALCRSGMLVTAEYLVL